MVGDSDSDRAYLMALSSWKTFGHTSEPQRTFAGRIAAIGAARGVAAAAEAVAEDCRRHGLEMSAGRVLKGLAHELERHRELLGRLGSIEDFPTEELGTVPPGVARFLELAHGRGGSRSEGVPWGGIGCMLAMLAVAAFVGWLVFR